MITWILIVLVALFLIIKFGKRPKNFPPGPRGLPVVGYGPFLYKDGKLGHEVMNDLSAQYGPVVGLYLGTIPGVFVNGYEAVRQCLTSDEFMGRPTIIKLHSFDQQLGLLFVEGNRWKEQRRFTFSHLKDFGFGREQQVETDIHSEVSDLLDDMERRSHDDIVVTDLFGVSVINILWAMIAGERYPYGDEFTKKLLGIVEDIFHTGNPTGGFWAAFPKLKKVFPNLSGHTEDLKRKLILQGFIQEQIDQHKADFDDNHMRDFIDTFIKEMKIQGEQSTFTENQLIALCTDMFMAGSETTTSFVRFSLLYMVLHPDVQKKVQSELDQVVGNSRLPSLKDKTNLPYTEATMMELLRVSSVAPFTIPHRSTTEAKLLQYIVTEGSYVMVNLWSVHMDKNHWGDPESFRPERFIKNGKIERDDWLMPFGIGKRACAGESLAKGASFLFFTAILQKFNLSVPHGQKPPDPRPIGGFTMTPKPFSVKATLR